MSETGSAAVAQSDTSIGYVWFSFDGRISRSTYWLKYFLVWVGIYIVAAVLDAIVGTGVIISLVVYIVGLWPAIAVSVKRCHDRNRSGWFLLVSLIPIIAIWVIVEIWFLRGTIGENRFGPDPVVD
jgi:uncharacterized membrane protein YhaH (DUF805 family)